MGEKFLKSVSFCSASAKNFHFGASLLDSLLNRVLFS